MAHVGCPYGTSPPVRYIRDDVPDSVLRANDRQTRDAATPRLAEVCCRSLVISTALDGVCRPPGRPVLGDLSGA